MKKICSRHLGVILAIIMAVALLPLLWRQVARPMMRFVQDPAAFRVWVQEKGIWGGVVYMGMCALQVILAFIPGEPFEIAGGYAFGWLGGTLLCLAGLTLGSAAVFLLVKRFGVKAAVYLSSRAQAHNFLFLEDKARLFRLLFLLFLLPGSPKDILCCCAALTPMSFPAFLLITSVARIPSVLSSALGGSALGSGHFSQSLLIFSVTAAVSLAGFLIYQRASNTKSKKETEGP